MNGSKKAIKAVIDINVIFMSWYNPFGKCADIIRKAREDKIELFSPISVKEEIIRVFKKNNQTEKDIEDFLSDLPITWIEKEIYEKVIKETKVKHKADKPIESLSLILDCGILSANKHFKDRINVNKLLKEIESV